MVVKFYNMGCKVNQFETQALRERFCSLGYTVTDSDHFDVAVVNSCAVTMEAERKCLKLLRRIKREHPTAVLAVMGCMAQTSSDHIPADVVCGTADRLMLPKLIEDCLGGRNSVSHLTDIRAVRGFEQLDVNSFSDNFQRAFLKVEDGCDRFCAYCIIPYARGPVRSAPLEYIHRQAAALSLRYKEIVLTGINLSRYGSDLGLSLPDAVRTVSKASQGNSRIRLGSVEPDLVDQAALKQLSEIPGFCPHFHMALQSGCNKTLSSMGRRYDTSLVLERIKQIEGLFLNPSITADVIVGFPGETDEDFEETCAFIENIGLMRCHIFEYSPRPGTRAADMENQIDPQVKHSRAKRLAAVAALSGQRFFASQLGREARVLVEATGSGYADNYLYVKLPAGQIPSSFCHVKLTEVCDSGCTGQIIQP